MRLAELGEGERRRSRRAICAANRPLSLPLPPAAGPSLPPEGEGVPDHRAPAMIRRTPSNTTP